MDWDDPGRRGYFERNREFLAQVAPLDACLTEDPIQVMFTGPVAPLRELAALLPQLAYAADFALAVTEYADRNFSLVDVMRAGCSKGAALAAWAAHRGLTRDEVMAIGDNLNDLEMLQFAGAPVVMANSVPALLANGWHVTASHDNAGVAQAIAQFALP
jgi:hydroxymethylpyrimidine pyrophosphatase-like HAD family hydrolase